MRTLIRKICIWFVVMLGEHRHIKMLSQTGLVLRCPDTSELLSVMECDNDSDEYIREFFTDLMVEKTVLVYNGPYSYYINSPSLRTKVRQSFNRMPEEAFKQTVVVWLT